MTHSCRILALDDRPEDVELARRELAKGDRAFTVKRVDSKDALLAALEGWEPDLVLCEVTLRGFTGLSALGIVREKAPEVPVIMYAGSADEETAAMCLKAGAHDYVLKDRLQRLHAAVEAALLAQEEKAEKMEALAALEASEGRFRHLVETANDAIVSFDSHGIVESLNPAGEAIFGYEAEELLGQSVQLLFSGAGLAAMEEHLVGETEHQGLPGLHEPLRLVGRRSEGTTFPAEASLSGFQREDGYHFDAVIRDTSERAHARDTIESLTRQYELLLNSAGEGIVGLDPDGTVSFVNPAASGLLGVEARNLLGQELRPFIREWEGGEGDRSREGDPVRASLQDGSRFQGEILFSRLDETTFTSAASIMPIVDGEEIRGAVMIFEDITLRKEQDAALRASEERYRGVVEHATYGIYRSTMSGRFTAVNPALVEMLGYDSAEELLAVDMERDLYADDGERERLVDEFTQKDPVVGAETRWLRKDGTVIDIRLSGRGIWNGDGSFQAFEVLVEDLTERKVLEAQLRQAQKMEAVGQLTGGIAHDFNNVLSVILLNAELLAAAVEAGEEVDVADLRAIYDSAQRASSITRKLLGFSRQAALLIEPCDLARVVGNMESMVRTALPETIDLEVNVEEGLPRTLADKGSVEQILLNLAGNARDAMPEGGSLRVAVYGTELDEEYAAVHAEVNPGSFLCLEVADTGIGMDEEIQQRVFDPFFTTKAPDAGTGLGMAMVYGLTKQQGGHVNLYSQVGEGTIVRLYFPILESEAGAVAPQGTEVEEGAGSATVLLVEDEEQLRDATKRALERSGHTVLSAQDGEEALEVLSAHREEIDLVISDLVLPRMGGGELLRKARARFGPIPFILTSGYSGEEVAARGIGDDSVPFLRKPWVLKDLLSVIRGALDPERSRKEESHG